MDGELDLITASAVIDALGGNKAVAKLFGINESAVSMWRSDGIPIARRFEIVRRLGDKAQYLPADFIEKGVVAA